MRYLFSTGFLSMLSKDFTILPSSLNFAVYIEAVVDQKAICFLFGRGRIPKTGQEPVAGVRLFDSSYLPLVIPRVPCDRAIDRNCRNAPHDDSAAWVIITLAVVLLASLLGNVFCCCFALKRCKKSSPPPPPSSPAPAEPARDPNADAELGRLQ